MQHRLALGKPKVPYNCDNNNFFIDPLYFQNFQLIWPKNQNLKYEGISRCKVEASIMIYISMISFFLYFISKLIWIQFLFSSLLLLSHVSGIQNAVLAHLSW